MLINPLYFMLTFLCFFIPGTLLVYFYTKPQPQTDCTKTPGTTCPTPSTTCKHLLPNGHCIKKLTGGNND